MRQTFRVLSALLSYPTEELQAAVPELRRVLDRENVLPRRKRERLDRILDELASGDIYDLQERWLLLFDRTRSLSLHLFEHVHGESRDRGQAMVDLASLYQQHGMAISANELPDYLPLFLEFLAEVDAEEAKGLITETAHILEMIRLRLKKRSSAYSSIFAAAQALADAKAPAAVAETVEQEPVEDPHDLEALDAAWLDEEVKFGPDADACGRDALASKLRAARRSAEPSTGMPSRGRGPVVTVNGSSLT